MNASQTSQPAFHRPEWLRFRFGYLLILAAVILFSVKFVEQTWHDHQRGLEVAAMQDQLAQIRQNNQLLGREIKRYRRLSFVYQDARSLGYVKPGDRPVIISYDPIRPKTRKPQPVRRNGKPVSNPQQWWNAFFGGSGH